MHNRQKKEFLVGASWNLWKYPIFVERVFKHQRWVFKLNTCGSKFLKCEKHSWNVDTFFNKMVITIIVYIDVHLCQNWIAVYFKFLSQWPGPDTFVWPHN